MECATAKGSANRCNVVEVLLTESPRWPRHRGFRAELEPSCIRWMKISRSAIFRRERWSAKPQPRRGALVARPQARWLDRGFLGAGMVAVLLGPRIVGLSSSARRDKTEPSSRASSTDKTTLARNALGSFVPADRLHAPARSPGCSRSADPGRPCTSLIPDVSQPIGGHTRAHPPLLRVAARGPFTRFREQRGVVAFHDLSSTYPTHPSGSFRPNPSGS